MSKKSRNAKKAKLKKLQARKAKKALKRQRKLKALRVPTPPRIDYAEVVLGLLDDREANPESVYDYIMETAANHELEKFGDALEDLVLEMEMDDPMLEKVKALNELFIADLG